MDDKVRAWLGKLLHHHTADAFRRGTSTPA
jgi:hypothetical protein